MPLEGVTWRSEPTFRGSFGILSVCATTLWICVWSAIHTDIPVRKRGWLWPLVDKLGWLLVGLIAPELLLFIAFNQRYTATHLLTQANLHLFSSEKLPRGWMDKVFMLYATIEERLEQWIAIDNPRTQLMNQPLQVKKP
ncbi:hypothetical protein K435DRAFT_797771 [Dendrothele bispora CBS 962.96]|uniref:Uncharacterized protein n=1 Tax=Dendrothele bispora (strain CBS 962.96) TaxID=1314807 RepID=A0A4S8M1F1_DENBC|nr:hypothetical protein K435DRAFT_797771 [Dendrothele bispora CBS 962.96]